MAGKNIAVYGTYRSDVQAERAAATLVECGFASEEISKPSVSENGVQLLVRCNSAVSVTRAENLLKQTGAQDIVSS
jgi:hypothetical protein